MKKKKIPLRKCLACGENKEKRELVRIVKNKENQVLVDFTGKVNGRGAYICPEVDCLNQAITTNKIGKSLQIDIEKDRLEEIRDEIISKIDSK